jgi:hypothetical protein
MTMKTPKQAIVRLEELGFVAEISEATGQIRGGTHREEARAIRVYMNSFTITPNDDGSWHVGISSAASIDDEHLTVASLEEAVHAVHRGAIERGWLKGGLIGQGQ